jgi:hypothetical protein
LGLVNNANAAFLGDDVTVSLTVHTTGAVDQVVWSSQTETIGYLVEYAGDSQPAGAGAPLLWNLDFDPSDCCFVLAVEDVNGVGPTTVDPLLLTITFADNTGWLAALGGDLSGLVQIGGINTFGFLPGDISASGNSITISVPAGALAVLANGGVLVTEFCIVPEASSIMLTVLAASGVAGGVFWRRRRSS